MSVKHVLRAPHLAQLADAVMRTMWLDFATHGLSRREIEWWTNESCWFPHLRTHQTVRELEDALPAELRTGNPCEPQLLWGMPEPDTSVVPWPHLDEPPPWAKGRQYARIVGVALTPWTPLNGSPHLHTAQGVASYTLRPGDILVMPPDMLHSRGINRSGEIRGAAYFRYLK